MQPSIPWSSSVSIFVIERTAIIYSLKCMCCFHWLYHCCHSLSLIAIYCHSLSLVVLLVVTLYHLLHHSLSLVDIRCHSPYHSLSLAVPLVVTSCHSLSLDVPLVCLFIKGQSKLVIFLFINPFCWSRFSNIWFWKSCCKKLMSSLKIHYLFHNSRTDDNRRCFENNLCRSEIFPKKVV